jgi:hypothetical protein
MINLSSSWLIIVGFIARDKESRYVQNFSDFGILVLEKDPSAPRVSLKARKPIDYKPTDLYDNCLILYDAW